MSMNRIRIAVAGGGRIPIDMIHELGSLRRTVGAIAAVRAFTSGATRGFVVQADPTACRGVAARIRWPYRSSTSPRIRGEAEPLVTARHGLQNLRVTEAIAEAAKTGRTMNTN